MRCWFRAVRLWRLPAHRHHRSLFARHSARCRNSPRAEGLVLGICNGFQILSEPVFFPAR